GVVIPVIVRRGRTAGAEREGGAVSLDDRLVRARQNAHDRGRDVVGRYAQHSNGTGGNSVDISHHEGIVAAVIGLAVLKGIGARVEPHVGRAISRGTIGEGRRHIEIPLVIQAIGGSAAGQGSCESYIVAWKAAVTKDR